MNEPSPQTRLEPVSFDALPGWAADDHAAAFASFLKSCGAIRHGTPKMRRAKPIYGGLYTACTNALALGRLDRDKARAFFEREFNAYRVAATGQSEGFFTGYHESEVLGSRTRTDEYKVPIYTAPAHAIKAKLSKVFPHLDRTRIEEGALAGKGLEICWVKNPVDLFFAQIQGSTRVRLDDGKTMRLNYIASNGHPYTPVGRDLIDRGIMLAGGGAPAVFDRADGYLGVMIDDLVTRGVTEPYRMFTSRAEYRLSLRADNADQRLTQRGIELGLVGEARSRHFTARMEALDSARALARSLTLTPSEAARLGLRLNQDGIRRSAFELLAYPDVGVQGLAPIWPALRKLDRFVAEQIETDARYAVYLERQAEDAARFRQDDATPLPLLDYTEIPGLSNEMREKLLRARPATVGQASRIDGITPAAIMLLLTEAKRLKSRSVA